MVIFRWSVGYGLPEADLPEGRTVVVWSGSLGGSRRCGQVTAKSSDLDTEDGGPDLLTPLWLAVRSSINRRTAKGCSGDLGGERAVTQVIPKRGESTRAATRGVMSNDFRMRLQLGSLVTAWMRIAGGKKSRKSKNSPGGLL